MRLNDFWKIGALVVLFAITVGIGLHSSRARAGDHPLTEPTNCNVPCPETLRVNDNCGGIYYCQHTSTCTTSDVGQSCDYEPVAECFHIPNPDVPVCYR